MKYENHHKNKLNEHHQQVAKAIKLYLDSNSYEEFQLNKDLDAIPDSIGRYYGLNTFGFINWHRNWSGSKHSVEGFINFCYFSSMILLYVSAIIFVALTKWFWLIGIYFPIGYIICDFLRKIYNLDHTIQYFERTRDINDYYESFKAKTYTKSINSLSGNWNISATITTSNGNTTVGTNASVNTPEVEKSKVSFEEILDFIKSYKWHI